MPNKASETGQMIADTALRILGDHCTAERLRATEGGLDRGLWDAMVDAGLTMVLEPQGKGRFGVSAFDAFVILRLLGRFSAPAPLADAMFANWLLLSADLEPSLEVVTFAGLHRADRVALNAVDAGWSVAGEVAAVPWGRFAQSIVVVVDIAGEAHVAVVPTDGAAVSHGQNLAGEPRDAMDVNVVIGADAVRPLGRSLLDIRALAAGVRVAQMAGALQKVVGLTVDYAQQRVQFGRPIAKLQAIQQNIAIMGAQAAAAGAAASLVAADFDRPEAVMSLAAAKIRAGEAAGIASRQSHQVHGAIGFTQEYALHFATKRLWSWRDEFGTEAEWSRLLGQEVCRRGADAMWPFIAGGLQQETATPECIGETAQ